VRVRAGARNIAPAVEPLLKIKLVDCRVVIEAGDLRRNAPLRVVCERAKNAVALPCYPDAEKDLLRLIDDEMRDAGLAISAEARAALVPLLGGDRLASRHEIRKVALFARGKARVELDDVMAVVADASTLAVDGLVDAAFAGRTGELEIQFGKARTAGTAPGTILGAALRHVAQLHRARLSIDEGTSVGEAAAGIQPFVHFSRKPAVESALRIWTSARLQRAMAQLAEAALEARQQSAMAEPIAQRALLTLAVDARRKESSVSS
jgi:DNA polymerase-3 subunit delta